MRLFWSIIGIFTIFAVALAVAHLRAHDAGAMLASATGPAERPVASDPITAPPVRDRAGEDAARDNRAVEQDNDPEAPPAADEADDEPPTVPGPGAGDFDPGAFDDDEYDAAAQDLADELMASADQGDHDHPDGPDELPQAENPWIEGEAANDGRDRIKHSIERRDNGTMILDELFEVRGEGTPEKPYEITWELLMSAAETFQPRLGMDEIPERLQMLDGAHVKISGHVLFATAGFEATELLVMLNMWDGCCIGTMPSPYDAIEVTLKEGVTARDRQFMNYGTVTGKLSIDPYLINDWLIGLYVLEDAVLNPGL